MTADLPPRDYWPTDGWRTADPANHGLDAARLDRARDYLRATVPHINSLLVVRGGDLVYEYYRDTAHGAETLRNVKSMTKSVLAILTGIALNTGDLGGIDEQLGYILPEAFATVDDKDKRTITIRDLLAMKSGLDWVEYGPSVIQMTASKNWVQFALNNDLIHPPGTHFNYSTGDSQLLAAALQRLTDMTLSDYADLYLFQPLGIGPYRWPTDPQGISIGGAELQFTPRDMAKFGYLLLNRGRWADQTIITADWIDAATDYHTLFEPSNPVDCDVLGYGYLFWLRPQGDHDSFIAVGYGGQFVYVIPALDMVVVLTGDLDDLPEPFRNNRMLCQFNLVEDFIIPAVG